MVGLHGTPKHLQDEAHEELGLPNMFLSGTRGTSNNTSPSNYMQLQDIIQMVVRQQEQEEPIMKMSDDVHDNNAAPSTSSSLGTVEEVRQSNGLAETLEVAEQEVQKQKEPQQSIPPEATIYQGSVRSGQQVSSERGQSLVIIGSVNPGGEVLSDGDITILGKLRGRAVAGLSSSNAKIIATSMDPELVCVSSVLATIDNMQVHGIPTNETPVIISLNDEKDELVFQPIQMT